MVDILSYISKKIENGMSFDNLVGNLLSYKPEIWGYTEQNYETIGSEFGAESNSLYYLPVGNYKLTNLPNSPLATDFVNISVYEQNGKKLITCDAGGNEKYITELTSVTSPIVWSDISDIDSVGNNIIPFSIGNTPPTNTTMIWIDTSKLHLNNSISLKCYSNKSWVSYDIENNMLQSIYDPNNIRKDPYTAVIEAIDALVDGRLSKFYIHREDTDIHITIDDRELYDTLILEKNIPIIFAEDGELYTEILGILQTRLETGLDYAISEQIISESTDKIDEHISTHITQEMIDNWDSKSSADHTHYLDGRVNLTIDNIAGFIDKWVTKETTIVNWQSVCYGDGKFVVIPYYNTGVNTFYYSIDGIIWHTSTVGEEPRIWKCICYGDGKFIALSFDSILAYSTDGITWTEVTMTSIARNWFSICYGDGKFIAVAYNSKTFAYSADGIIWVEVNINTEGFYWISICYGNGKFIAITSSDNLFAYSTDGITWATARISVANNVWTSLCYGNGKFVIVGMDGSIAYSTTGITWVEILVKNEERYWISVCYGNGKFVVLDYGTDIFAYSVDGINWVEDRIGTPSNWSSIAYGNAKFIAVSHNYIFGKLGVVIFPHDKFSTEISERVYEISSFDILSSSEEVADLLDSKYHNGNTLYVEDESGITIWKKIIDNSKFGTPNYKEGLKDFSILSPTNYSSISNTPNTFSGYNISDAVSKNELEAVKDVTHYVYTPSEYQIDAIGDSDIYVGIQKTLSNDGGGTEEYPMSTPHAELDVILAADAKTKSSSVQTHKCNCEADKCAYIERWIEGSIGTTNIEWIDICYGDGKYIAIGYDNETPCMSIAYSSDGLIWNFANIPSDVIDIRLYSVCYGDGKFVAVGELVAGGGAPIVYSSDGINWKVYLNIDLASLCSVCYGDGKFVAISEYDTVYTYSTDGINWTYCDIDSSTWTTGWKSICYGDGKFVVVGVCNNIAYSVNGIDWVVFDASPDTNTILLSVCYGNGKFVALGNDGNTDMYY